MSMSTTIYYISFVFFNDTATTEIYTLSLHDALPISPGRRRERPPVHRATSLAVPSEIPPTRCRGHPIRRATSCTRGELGGDRKSTRLNSSHANISYAVFCLKKKKINN